MSELAGVDSFDIAHDRYDLLYVVKEQLNGTTLVQLNYGDSKKTHNPATPEQMGPNKPPCNHLPAKE